jgi:hypothetical protein
MRAFFGNNCAKGCLIYIFAFALLVVVSSMGLSRLGSRFGVSQIQGIQPDLSVPQAAQGLTVLQSGPASLNQSPLDGGMPPTPVSVPPTLAPTQPGPQPTIAPPPSQQGQGGTISGGSSQPFYIVQPGDTLWAIAQKFGVSIDAIRSANNITGDFIYPGEVIYLPVPGQSGVQSSAPPGNPPAGTQPNGGASNQGQSQDAVPGMPDTGITSRKP